MNHHMIGQLLQARYQIVQSLGAGAFGHTYIAVDKAHTENSKCVIKNLKANSFPLSYLDNLRLCFLNETATFHLLGNHPQIPQFITYFQENEQLYLVQEFVEGHSLSAELPINNYWGCNWTESEVVELLEDVLSTLEFVHSQGVIHCDIKPENLIRRSVDGKLVLIDFAPIQSVDVGESRELPIYGIPLTSLGYIPPEQFIGQTQPNSDIYALGIIAIQALTGLEPLEFQIDPQTNEMIWRTQDVSVNDYLAAVISQMIRYDYQERFQSAGEVLHILKQMVRETEILDEVSQNTTIESDDIYQELTPEKLPSLLTGMKVGLAANSLLMGLGVYSVMNNSPAYTETEILYKATEEYQTGDLQKALALAKLIPAHSNVYPEAKATIQEWQHQWQFAAEQYKIAEQAFDQGRWSDVLDIAPKVPDILYWQSKVDKLVQQAQVSIERQTQNLLSQAYEKAIAREFSTAIEYLRQIPQESSAGALVQDKLAEYSEKRQIRAAYFLHNANVKASIGDFNGAVKLLRKIPKNTPVYPQAQAKLNEYSQKQQIQTKSKNVALNSFSSKKSTIRNEHSHPENHLQEVNIR
ncbi:serine/threonine-protein kinase [Nodularia sphaerocarpa]|uniref:serine/threonine-protein kinase n=1 Tax=Nodularia sphaerocarpa TaxID=137816 RepID=UPI001EFBD644|nr:serine/threonine-protein kinase [Nodularia sphaerocarpa]MDB9375862.1 serine/threonine-protein kinase [Nodularia sphaerocarpa CS-585]MDB9376424.1 serine/threonine-protein kinase [Nodularia sphaerocarpa CS-585A2]ULP71821.1 Serine/threonine-protein kinase C [Nodularia sphaerocarpa UHCC 0038]